MTTIVVRVGEGMASDTGFFTENKYMVGGKKIFRLKGGALFGGFGIYSASMRMKKFIDGDIKEISGPSDPEDFGPVGVLLTPGSEGRIFLVEHNATFTPIFRSYDAYGTGGEYALGAMAAGASLIEAVEISKEFCHYVRGDVDFVRI